MDGLPDSLSEVLLFLLYVVLVAILTDFSRRFLGCEVTQLAHTARGRLRSYLERFTGKSIPEKRRYFVAAGVLTLVLGFLVGMAFWSSSPVTRCDRLAGIPDYRNPDSGTGVKLADIRAEEAIPACREAVAKREYEARLEFQYGRALEAGGKYREAFDHYEKSASLPQKFTAAMEALGRMLVQGKGVQKDAAKAVAWFRRAANLGDPPAQASLGLMYEYGLGVENKNAAEAMRWQKKATQGGNAESFGVLGHYLIDGIGGERNCKEAAKILVEGSQTGDALSMNNLGYLYYIGCGVEKDLAKAFAWYREAADRDLPLGLYNLGLAYQNGRGVEKDNAEAKKFFAKALNLFRKRADEDISPWNEYWIGEMLRTGHGGLTDNVEAARWYRRAAEKNHSRAQTALGSLYESGNGVDKDLKQAVHWYKLAAEDGNASAQTNLGYLYEKGRGVEQDFVKARKYYETAAEKNFAGAQFRLGWLYEHGLGVRQDYVESARWYRMAAEQGDGRAQNNLGFMYENGSGVAKNPEEAVRWYRMAAEQGNAYAINNLAVAYQHGRGVKRDYDKALEYYTKAAKLGDALATKNLGYMYKKLIGKPPDPELPDKLFREKMENWKKGIERDFVDVGILHYQIDEPYDHGQGIEGDRRFAAEWYRRPDKLFRAAMEIWKKQVEESNDINALYGIGQIYDYGFGVDRDRRVAAEWYGRAASLGNIRAQYRLGVLLRSGDGIEPDIKQALIWLEKAAVGGHREAQEELGQIYKRGLSELPPNLAKALDWYRMAARQNDPKAIASMEEIYRGIIATDLDSVLLEIRHIFATVLPQVIGAKFPSPELVWPRGDPVLRFREVTVPSFDDKDAEIVWPNVEISAQYHGLAKYVVNISGTPEIVIRRRGSDAKVGTLATIAFGKMDVGGEFDGSLHAFDQFRIHVQDVRIKDADNYWVLSMANLSAEGKLEKRSDGLLDGMVSVEAVGLRLGNLEGWARESGPYDLSANVHYKGIKIENIWTMDQKSPDVRLARAAPFLGAFLPSIVLNGAYFDFVKAVSFDIKASGKSSFTPPYLRFGPVEFWGGSVSGTLTRNRQPETDNSRALKLDVLLDLTNLGVDISLPAFYVLEQDSRFYIQPNMTKGRVIFTELPFDFIDHIFSGGRKLQEDDSTRFEIKDIDIISKKRGMSAKLNFIGTISSRKGAIYGVGKLRSANIAGLFVDLMEKNYSENEMFLLENWILPKVLEQIAEEEFRSNLNTGETLLEVEIASGGELLFNGKALHEIKNIVDTITEKPASIPKQTQ